MARNERSTPVKRSRRHAPAGGVKGAVLAAGLLAVMGVAAVLVSGLLGGSPVLTGDAGAGPSSSAEVTSSADATTTEVPSSAAVATAAAEAPSVGATPIPEPPPPPRAVIAWQPSHQGDTGYDGWREYEICGDIMERTIGLLDDFSHVRAWTLEHGLTGSNSYARGPSNTKAFDVELELANAGQADAFVSLHNDGGAPSGVLGMCMPGDARSRALAEQLVASVCASTGLSNRGIREERLYSLESDKNHAELRLLLEIGDNQRDRELLEDPAQRQVIAGAIASGVRAWDW